MKPSTKYSPEVRERAVRLVDGNILDAYGTDLFGEGVTRSAKSKEKLERLARLNRKRLRKPLRQGAARAGAPAGNHVRQPELDRAGSVALPGTQEQASRSPRRRCWETSLRRRRPSDHPAWRVGYPATVVRTLPESVPSSPNPSRPRTRGAGSRRCTGRVGPWSKARGPDPNGCEMNGGGPVRRCSEAMPNTRAPVLPA